jgi:hypothetical protein
MYEYNVDFYLNGDWQDKTTDIKQNPPIKITGGVKDEAASISPGKCSFSVNGTDYNPRNPVGAYFGELGKNTPVRVRHQLLADNVSETDTDGWGANWDNGAGSGGTVANTDWSRTGTTTEHSVPAASAYRTSLLKAVNQYWDSCLRTRVTLPTNNIAGGAVWSEFQFRYTDANNYLAVQFLFNTDETVLMQVVDVVAGTNRILLGLTTIAGLSVATDQSFELATLVEGQAVRTKIWATGDPEPADWQTTCTRATVRYGRNGIRSTVNTGNSNTKPFDFTYTNTVVEARPFVGEISEFIPKVSDESHAAPYVQITASGITKRTIAGSEPFKSASFRWWSADQKWVREGAALATATGDTNTLKATDADAADVTVGDFFRLLNNYEGTNGSGDLKEDQLFTITSKSSSGGVTDINFTPDAKEATIATDNLHTDRLAVAGDLPICYWPCEDGKDATNIASGLTGGTPMSYTVATPDFASKDSFIGSGPLLKLNNAELYTDIVDYTDTNQAFTLHFLLHMPDVDEAATGTDILQFYTTGTAENWEIQYATGGGNGDLVIRATGSGIGGALLFSTPYDLHARGTPIMVTLALQHTAPTTVTYSLTTAYFDNAGTFTISGPATATATGVSSLGKIKSIRVNPAGGYVDVGFGHLAVVPSAMDYFNFLGAPRAYLSEEVIKRLIRLGYEENIPMTFCGTNKPAVQQMGAQREATVLENMQDAALFDGGRFYEARGAYSFEYRTRATLYNQTPYLEVDYSVGGVLAELRPTDDDKDIRNDVTAKRIDGGFARAVQETGRLSIQAPSNGGVGRYTESVDLAAQKDEQLPAQASWRLHLGTVDEERYPSIKFSPVNGDITMAQLLSTGVGNRFKVNNLDARNVYEPIDQLVLGYTLVLDQHAPYVEINGEPARPYNVADIDTARMDSETSTLNEDLDTTETAIDVATTGGTLWTTDAGEFPFDVLIGGERMTVSAISGASSPQTFTVTRSVNGVVKTHTTGTQVSLADPVYLPL